MDPRLLWPNWIKPSAIPVTIVAGAPASGKSTWVREHMQPRDVLIDVDAIHRERTGRNDRVRSESELAQALAVRNQKLGALAFARTGKAYFIVGAPGSDERDKWARLLQPEAVIVMETPVDECLRRIAREPDRAEVAGWMTNAVRKWWKRYEPRQGEETTVKWAHS
jgi:5-methylcytosine-specific restriction protein A